MWLVVWPAFCHHASRRMKRKTLLSLASLTLAHVASGQTLSINFGSNEPSGSISTASSLTAGAIPVAGLYWNNESGATGSGALVDSAGASSGASVTWSSANTWRSNSTGATATSLNGVLTKGYLDDGGSRANVTVTNVPYLTYNVYFIGGTDLTGYTSPKVNGVNYTYSGTPGSGSTVVGTANWGTSPWSNANTLTEGAIYLKVQNQASPTLTVQGGGNGNNNVNRGSLSGIQIENSFSGSLAYWDIDGATAGAGGATPAGNWSGSNWSLAVNGDAAANVWTSGHAAVFAAGTGATGTYAVNLGGTESAEAVWVQEGQVTLSGGQLNLGTTGLLRADGSGSLTVSSALGGTTVSTVGTVTLSGTGSYTGSTSVQSGTLTANGGSAIPDASGVLLASGTTLSLGASEAIGSLNGAGTVALGTNQLTSNNAGTNAFSGVFTGSGAVVLNGTGSLALSGSSTAYTGNLTVGAGVTLSAASSATAFGTNAGTTTVQSGGTIMINSATGSYNQPGADENFIISGTGVDGAGALSSNGGGGGIIRTITLADNASIGGTTRWDIGGGGAGQQAVVNGNGKVLTKTGANNIWMRGVANGASITNLAGLVINQGVFGVEFGDNALGSTPVTVNTGGTFSAWSSSPSNLQGNPITLNGGTLDVDAGSINFTGVVTLTANSFVSSNDGSMTVSGAVGESGGSYGLTKIAANTLTLSGTNSYTGTTSVNAGTLAVSNGAALPDNSPLVLTGGGLQLNNSETVGTLSGGAGGSVALGANTLSVNQSADGTLAGAISGTGGLTKSGSANLILTGASGMTGPTQVNNGTLTLGIGGAGGSLGSSAITVATGATLAISTGDGTGYGSNAQITVRGTLTKTTGNFHDTLNRPVLLDGGTISATDGNTTSGAAYNLFGNTITTAAGTTSNINITGTTLQLRMDGATAPAFDVVASSTLNVNAVVDGYLGTEATPLNKSGGGTMVLTQANLYDGATNINGGTLRVAGSGSLGNGTQGGALSIASAASFEYASTADQTLSGAITGDGAISKSGASTLTLTGASTSYAGDVSVTGGSLFVNGDLGSASTDVTAGNGATVGGTGMIGGNLALDGGSTLNIADINDALGVGGLISLTSAGFGIDNLTGIDWNTIAAGEYTLLTGTLDPTNLDDFGLGQAVTVAPGKDAYFANGSLKLVVIPESSTILLGSFGALALLRRRRV